VTTAPEDGAFIPPLTENGDPVLCPLDHDVAAALSASRLVTVEAWGGGQYRLTPGTRVGAVRIRSDASAVEVRVAPKVGITRLMFLLGYAADPGWRDEDVEVTEADDLMTAVIDALARGASRVLGQGVLQGYRTVDDALPLVRGRILTGAQMARRFALPLPVEVRYDEYDADIAENQILLTACRLAVGVPQLREETHSRLLHATARLDGVSPLRPGMERPTWRPSRLNDRYVGALRLAELVLDHLSVEAPVGHTELHAAGFVVSMWKVFEDFVTIALAEALAAAPGATHCQYPIDLDVGGLVPMRPDLVHLRRGRPVLVVDSKYKAERLDGYPNADAYQLLAYCTALRLKHGHLVYAKGNEEPRLYDIRQSDVVIRAHALDLLGTPAQLLTGMADLAADLLADAQ
jgi:5-methylcytosine-specific restriction enzyme subunit McrC